MKKFILAVMMFFSVAAFAGTSSSSLDVSGLTPQQTAALSEQINNMKTDSADKLVSKVDKYVDVGERIGKMMGGAAKEVGVAVNDFVKTPVGLMTAGLIVWHYMGGMMVHVISGWAFLIISFSLLFWYSRRVSTMVIEYDIAGGRNWMGKYPVIKVNRDAMDESALIAILFGYMCSTIISIWIMFSW